MKILCLSILLIVIAMHTQAAPRCDEVLQSAVMLKSIKALAQLKLQLELSKTEGIESLNLTALRHDYKKKEQEVFDFLKVRKTMSRAQFKARLKQEILNLQADQKNTKVKEEEQRRQQKQEIQIYSIDGAQAVFFRIEPKSFKMGNLGEQVDVEITNAFEMMATPTTQIIWKTVAELANSKLGHSMNTNPSFFRGDLRPVEQASYEEIKVWIMALNDLSLIGEPALLDLIPDHKKGDVYRLPTEAEWEFVIRGRGEYNDVYHFGNQESQLKDYAWFDLNANGETQPVAKKKPLLIDGKPFYDMQGNVWEWVQDLYQDKLPGGRDPQAPGIAGSTSRVLRGGSYNNELKYLNSTSRISLAPSFCTSTTGFRLVRTVK